MGLLGPQGFRALEGSVGTRGGGFGGPWGSFGTRGVFWNPLGAFGTRVGFLDPGGFFVTLGGIL